MKRYRLVNKRRFAISITAILSFLLLTVITIFNFTQDVDAKNNVIQIPENIYISEEGEKDDTAIKELPKVSSSNKVSRSLQPNKVEVSSNLNYESDKLNQYLVKKGLNLDRANLLLNSIERTNTKIPKSMILGIIQHESEFKNVPSSFPDEDSIGYVQMKSETIEWLKKVYPNLPYIKSQKEFQLNPESQIKYMIKYLEYADKKFNGDWNRAINSYNVGLNTDFVNQYYVKKVLEYKNDIDNFVYGI